MLGSSVLAAYSTLFGPVFNSSQKSSQIRQCRTHRYWQPCRSGLRASPTLLPATLRREYGVRETRYRWGKPGRSASLFLRVGISALPFSARGLLRAGPGGPGKSAWVQSLERDSVENAACGISWCLRAECPPVAVSEDLTGPASQEGWGGRARQRATCCPSCWLPVG